MNTSNQADLILHNGQISTLDPNHPEATSIVVIDGRIVGVDNSERYERGTNTKVIDLKGRRVIPGLNDSPPCHSRRIELQHGTPLGRRAIARGRPADVARTGEANAARTMGARGRWLERISICRTPDADAG